MLRNDECPERLVKHFCFSHDAGRTEVTFVTGNRVCENMVSEILLCLIGIAATGGRSMQKRKTEHVVGRLVPAVLAVIHNADAITPVPVSKIGPLLGIHFVCSKHIVSACLRAYAQIIHCLRVRNGKRELRFQKGVLAAPVNLIAYIDPVAFITFIKDDILDKSGITVFSRHTQGPSCRAALGNSNFDTVRNGYRLRVYCGFHDFPCRPAI